VSTEAPHTPSAEAMALARYFEGSDDACTVIEAEPHPRTGLALMFEALVDARIARGRLSPEAFRAALDMLFYLFCDTEAMRGRVERAIRTAVDARTRHIYKRDGARERKRWAEGCTSKLLDGGAGDDAEAAPTARPEPVSMLAADGTVQLPTYVLEGLGIREGGQVRFVADGDAYRIVSAGEPAGGSPP
jgi:hypothetical protein